MRQWTWGHRLAWSFLLLGLFCTAPAGASSTPVNASAFRYDVSDRTQCEANGSRCTDGVITYADLRYDAQHPDIMRIHPGESAPLPHAFHHLFTLPSFLDSTASELAAVHQLFNLCADEPCRLLGEIPDIRYPGADEVRAYATLDGPIEEENITIHILARTQADGILLSGRLPMHHSPVLKRAAQSCSFNHTEPSLQCLAARIRQSPRLQARMQQKAQQLVTLFALDNPMLFTFQAYPASALFNGPGESVRLDSHPKAARFQEVLTASDKQPVNFAGHYKLVEFGCGAACRNSFLVDARTGQVYSAPAAALGYAHEPGSRLLIVNPPEFIAETYGANPPRWLMTEWYLWNGNRFERLTPPTR